MGDPGRFDYIIDLEADPIGVEPVEESGAPT
jgi:hypothetical protein